MKISNMDIRNRINGLGTSYAYSESRPMVSSSLIQEEALKGSNIAAVKKSLRISANRIASESCDEIQEFDTMLDIFDSVCANESTVSSNIETAIRLLFETADRVRNPKEVSTLLKRRLTNATVGKGANKHKKNIETAGDVLDAASDNLKKNMAKLQANLAKSNNIGAKPSVVKSDASSKTNESAQLECYQQLIAQCDKNEQVDRILKNYDRLSRRFNIDKVLHNISEDFQDNVDVYCELLETWPDSQMNLKSKFNIAMETALFLNDKLHLNIDRGTIIESIVDYYIFREGNIQNPEAVYDQIYHFLEENTMVTESDMGPYTETYNRIHNIIPDGCDVDSVSYIMETADKKDKHQKNKDIQDFKAAVNKTPEKLKQLISKLYNQAPGMIFAEIPNLFVIIRWFVILATFAINPILGIVVFMTDQFIKLGLGRPEAAKMVDKYEKELEKVEKKIEKTDNEKKKQRLKDYRKTLEEQIRKLKEYENDLYTDEQNAQREAERDAAKNKDEDDEWDFDFNEAAAILDIIESVVNMPTEKFMNQIKSNITCLAESGILDTVVDFALENPDAISKPKLRDICLDEAARLKPESRSARNYITVDSLTQNANRLMAPYSENQKIDPVYRMLALHELYEAIDIIAEESNSSSILEFSFANTLNVVKTKIQSAFHKMSDTEKKVSQNIDVAFSGFAKNAENLFRSNNREAVIKGSIIPSASKIIKMALGAGLTAWLIHPVVAVIGILGYIGVSKYLQAKERQLVLDEIEIELKMVEKYIEQAEAKNDMKALKNLLTTQKKLKKEYSRIRYKIRMSTGKNPDSERSVSPK